MLILSIYTSIFYFSNNFIELGSISINDYSRYNLKVSLRYWYKFSLRAAFPEAAQNSSQ